MFNEFSSATSITTLKNSIMFPVAVEKKILHYSALHCTQQSFYNFLLW